MLRHLAPAILTIFLPVFVLAADAPKPQDITGRVLDASQKPIASADVTLCRTATTNTIGAYPQGVIVAKAKSAPDGSFAIQKIAPGNYAVSPETWNQNAATRRYSLPNPPTVAIESSKNAALTLELKEGVRIRGRLGTTPKNGHSPSVYLLDSNHSLQNLNADAKGNFEVYVPGPGSYTFYAQTAESQPLSPLPPVNVPTTQPIDDLVLTAPRP